jgi:hypothetical protein
MSDIVLPHTISADTLADAVEVQENFEALASGALNKAGDDMSGTLETLDVRPTTDATRDLGTALKQYRNLYLSGTVIGPAGSNAFGTVAVAGQTDVVADAASDTLTLVAGTGIAITTTPAGDSVTVTANSNSDAGSSSIDFAGGGTIYNYQSTTGTGNVGTGEDTLYSQAVAASVLATDGDAIEFYLALTWAANGNEKRLKVKFGSTTIIDNGTGYGIGGDIIIRGFIVRTSATTQVCSAEMKFGSVGTITDLVTAGETLSGAVTFALTGEATTTNDVVVKIARLIYHKDTPNN